jgi:hypothetical protein
MLGWLVDERGIELHVKVFDKAERTDGTFSRSDVGFEAERDLYVCPEGKELKRYRRAFSTPRDGVRKVGTIGYRASKFDCETCPLWRRNRKCFVVKVPWPPLGGGIILVFVAEPG